MQFFLVYLLYSLSQKNKLTSLFAAFNTFEHRQKNSCAMHKLTIKITPNLLFEYQCASGKFIRLPNRIESLKNRFGSENLIESNINFFSPELKCSTANPPRVLTVSALASPAIAHRGTSTHRRRSRGAGGTRPATLIPVDRNKTYCFHELVLNLPAPLDIQ